MLKHGFAALLCLIKVGSIFAESPLVDRVDTTAFIQIEATSFRTLSPKQQAVAYWLQQSSIAIDPIIYDQLSRFGLRQKRLLEAVITSKDKVDPAIYGRVLDFTKLFWASKGNHNELTSQKFMPKFTADDLKRALDQAGHKDLVPEVDALAQSLFDAQFEPLITAKSPSGGRDIAVRNRAVDWRCFAESSTGVSQRRHTEQFKPGDRRSFGAWDHFSGLRKRASCEHCHAGASAFANFVPEHNHAHRGL